MLDQEVYEFGTVNIGMREGNTETLRPGLEKFYLECGISDPKPILIYLQWKHTGLNWAEKIK